MKSAEDLYEENYKGFTSHSVSDAYKKGFIAGSHATGEEYTNLLEDVVNELPLTELAVDKHGQMGTPPAELVKLVLEAKDETIARLKTGLKIID